MTLPDSDSMPEEISTELMEAVMTADETLDTAEYAPSAPEPADADAGSAADPGPPVAVLQVGEPPSLGGSALPTATVSPESAPAPLGVLPDLDVLPDTGALPVADSIPTVAFVPPEMMARRRAYEAATRGIVMAPPLPPSLLTGSLPINPINPAEPGLGAEGSPRTGALPLGNGVAGYDQAFAGPMYGAPGYGGGPGYGAPSGYAGAGYSAPATGAMGQTTSGQARVVAPPTGSVGVATPANGFAPTGPGPSPISGQIPIAGSGTAPMPAADGRADHRKVLLAVVAGAVVLVVVIALGVWWSTARDKSPSAVAPKAPQLVTTTLTASQSSYDPTSGGSGFKHDKGGVWDTEHYKNGSFGGLKKGVGLVLDLSSARSISGVSFDAEQGPLTVQLLAGDQLPSSTSSALPSGFQSAGVLDRSATGATTLTVKPGAGQHRYWMIWVTGLAYDHSSNGANTSQHYAAALSHVKATTQTTAAAPATAG